MSALGLLGYFNISGQICRYRDCKKLPHTTYVFFSLLNKHYIIIFIIIVVIRLLYYLPHILEITEFIDCAVLQNKVGDSQYNHLFNNNFFKV